MKVLDLQCSQGHLFEGWFASESDFQSQKQRELVQCPLCDDRHVEKRLSAPRLNLGARPPADAHPGRDPEPPRSDAASGAAVGACGTGQERGADGVYLDGGDGSALAQAIQAAWLRAARHLARHAEDVGVDFAQEARRIHHGEAPERAIRGQATVEDAMALLDDGVAVLPLPLPAAAKETLQ
ncbi:MAG: DUF1178 family protein [Acidovorax sp.]|jgi:hypothetical protein